jgi:SagB-type dehydrogenase family enzyme
MLRRLAEGPAVTLEGEAHEFMAALKAGGWLTTTISWQGRPLYTLRPTRPSRVDSQLPAVLVLSRFAVAHRVGDTMLVESPLADSQLQVFHPEVMATLGMLAAPLRTSAMAAVGELPPEVVARTLADLYRAGLAVDADGAESHDWSLRQWSPHDLWLHHRSRIRDHSYPPEGFGRTGWAAAATEPPLRSGERYPGPAIDLYRPDLTALRVTDPPLATVMEERRSDREHDDAHPISLEQIGELLFRCARIRSAEVRDGVEYLSKPYPSGGAAFELEVYPVVRLASGLAAGMYHYDAREHRLRLLHGHDQRLHRMLRLAATVSAQERLPQVLLVITACFGRLMRNYEQIPYSLILRHTGVLYQTLYLAATSMGLAACGLGSGHATAFNDITGTDRTTESAVGEFLIGSLPKALTR